MNQPQFPPMSRFEMDRLGWEECDCIIVTGDAYVDHPSFGSAVIARVLLEAGYRVGIIAQPDWRTTADFTALGRPRLFFGITAGNVDSLVANYSPSGNLRRSDDYSPGGRPGLRPSRAVTVYANRIRHLFPGVPSILGGIEASLRRLAHYDFYDDAVRPSILLDTRADVLVYGMGERQAVEIARRLAAAEKAEERGSLLAGIAGTCVISRILPAEGHVLLPSLEDVKESADSFNRAFRIWQETADDPQAGPVAQKHGERYVVQYPMPAPMTSEELDRVYELPYARTAHPAYKERVPALDTVRFSIASHRGCLGSCTFCSLRAHQGRIIQRRSPGSIAREAQKIAQMPGFRGHITDVGGPTANMYGATCSRMKKGEVCREKECTWPVPCPNLRMDYDRDTAMLEAVCRVPGVKKVSIGTGVRYDLLGGQDGERYLERLCRCHVSGQLRVAPEHSSDRVLASMHKPAHSVYCRFREKYLELSKRLGRKQYLIPYFIAGHPGATIDDAVELAEYLIGTERFFVRQVQQFTPLPMTAAAAAYHTGKDPLTGREVHTARTAQEKRLQRALLQLHEPGNLAYVERELARRGRRDLSKRVTRLVPLLRGMKKPKRDPFMAGLSAHGHAQADGRKSGRGNAGQVRVK